MNVHETPTAKPGFIDRIRDLIAKIFGSPAHAPHRVDPVAAGGVSTTAQPAEKRAGRDGRVGDGAV
jgi:hypothetical protein